MSYFIVPTLTIIEIIRPIIIHWWRRQRDTLRNMEFLLLSMTGDQPRRLITTIWVKHYRYTPWRRLGERMYSSYSFMTSALDGLSGQRHAPAALYPGERTPGPHWTEGWVGPRAGLDTETRGKIRCPCRGSNLDRPVVQPVARHYTDWNYNNNAPLLKQLVHYTQPAGVQPVVSKVGCAHPRGSADIMYTN
jgi:hypothetical protein